MTEEINVKEINDRYIELWKEFENEVSNVPSLYPELKSNTLLFIGINPSCPDNKLEKRLNKINWNRLSEKCNREEYTKEQFKEWRCPFQEHRRKIIKDERRIAKGRQENVDDAYRYFSIFNKISEKAMGDKHLWEHIDVFRIIESDQNELKKRLEIDSKVNNLSRFGEEQFKIFKDLLNKLTPQVIVVQNAAASDLIQHKFGISEDDRQLEGFHTIPLKENKVPTFFTGILSVGYDKGSRKRLIWHIKKAKKWVEKNR